MKQFDDAVSITVVSMLLIDDAVSITVVSMLLKYHYLKLI
jgi:hypothetical protein